MALIESTPTFLVSEGLIVVNHLDTPVTATFTSQTSTTFSMAIASGASIGGLFGFLSINVSTTITSSTTTVLGVSAQGQVPPHGSVIGEYGVEAYHVTFDSYRILRRSGVPGCWVREDTMGFEVDHAMAPTHLQGWRLRLG